MHITIHVILGKSTFHYFITSFPYLFTNCIYPSIIVDTSIDYCTTIKRKTNIKQIHICINGFVDWDDSLLSLPTQTWKFFCAQIMEYIFQAHHLYFSCHILLIFETYWSINLNMWVIWCYNYLQHKFLANSLDMYFRLIVPALNDQCHLAYVWQQN